MIHMFVEFSVLANAFYNNNIIPNGELVILNLLYSLFFFFLHSDVPCRVLVWMEHVQC